jgi:hypothetical protein
MLQLRMLEGNDYPGTGERSEVNSSPDGLDISTFKESGLCEIELI